MSADIPTKEPRSFVAGETVQWTKSLDDYLPSDGWTLKYYLRGPGQTLDITCTADDNDDHLATILAVDSAKLAAGDYSLQGRVEKGSDKYVVVRERGLTVKPGLDSVSEAYDNRSTAKKIVDAIDALAEGKASLDQQSYKIADRELVRMSPKELTDLRTYYWNIYVREERAKRGGSTMQNINCGFQ